MQKKFPFEIRLTQLSLVASVPMLLMLLAMMVYAGISISLIILMGLIGGVLTLYSSYRIYQNSIYQFRRLSNLLDAMIQGDYSLRARSDHAGGILEELIVSINELGHILSKQRLGSIEHQRLAHIVIEHIDVAVVALSEKNKISFLNPAARKLLMLDRGNSSMEILQQLAFAQSFSSGHHQVVELSLGYRQGRFNVHVEEFRESGVQHKLLFITDVGTLLRSEERKAWQSLVKVISHEINNSLSPIASISQTLVRLISRESNAIENSKELIEGLTIISERANGLNQFVKSYKQLARLPEPQKKMVSIYQLVEKTRLLFKNQLVVVDSEIDVQLFIDPFQFEQVLINLFKNAIESMAQSNPHGIITITWSVTENFFKLMICDQGSGISNPDNLFVPFYSTKKHGSGIGLVLCRQIIEAHNGHLSVVNQIGSPGCCASIEILLNHL